MGRWTWIVVVVVAFLWSSLSLITDLPRIISGMPHAVDYINGMWPPDLSILTDLWRPLLETIQIAVVGTTLAAMISIPVSFLAARNTTVGLMVYMLTRSVVNVLRAIPTLLWAILFVAMVGLGPLAGVFAITCHSVGALGKYMSESIESVGPTVKEVLESMRTEGANEFQAVRDGLFPAVLPLFVSYILYYLEANIRSATVLGLVGAGGIGLYLTQTVRMFKRHQTLTVLLVILIVVLLTDALSRQIRKRFIE